MSAADEMLEHASALVRWAVTRFQHQRLPFGVTVIVHGAELTPGEVVTALHTTLATRAESRLALMHAIIGSLDADGVSTDNVGAVSTRELAEFEARARTRGKA